MKHIRFFVTVLATLTIFSTNCCAIGDEQMKKIGGPYYFKYGISYEGIRPSEEITQKEAKELENNGYAYYVAHFNDTGDPVLVEKHYKGKIFYKHELIYENNKHIKTIITDENGHQKTLNKE